MVEQQRLLEMFPQAFREEAGACLTKRLAGAGAQEDPFLRPRHRKREGGEVSDEEALLAAQGQRVCSGRSYRGEGLYYRTWYRCRNRSVPRRSCSGRIDGNVGAK